MGWVLSRLATSALALTLVLGSAACGGGEGAGDREQSGAGGADGSGSTTVTTSQATTTTTEAPDASGTYAVHLDLVSSVPAGAVPSDGRSVDRTYRIIAGDCPTEGTVNGPAAELVVSVEAPVDPSTCIGSINVDIGDGSSYDLPLHRTADGYRWEATIVGACVDAETREVLAPDGATSRREATFTIDLAADGAGELAGQAASENEIDPARCGPPRDGFATSTTFSLAGPRT